MEKFSELQKNLIFWCIHRLSVHRVRICKLSVYKVRTIHRMPMYRELPVYKMRTIHKMPMYREHTVEKLMDICG
jgi:hypothetical protein